MPPKKELTMRPSFGVFAFLSVLAFNPSAHAESYTLPGESSPPAAEELIGSPGLVGIYYGQLPKDGHPRLKMTLVLVTDPKSGEPKGYMLERIGVTREPNTRHITKGTWKRIKDGNRPGAVVYELDSGTSRVQPLLGDRSVNSLGFRKRPQSTSKWLGRSLYGGLRPLWFALQSRPEAKGLFC